jgi:hypothetical protein
MMVAAEMRVQGRLTTIYPPLAPEVRAQGQLSTIYLRNNLRGLSSYRYSNPGQIRASSKGENWEKRRGPPIYIAG